MKKVAERKSKINSKITSNSSIEISRYRSYVLTLHHVFSIEATLEMNDEKEKKTTKPILSTPMKHRGRDVISECKQKKEKKPISSAAVLTYTRGDVYNILSSSKWIKENYIYSSIERFLTIDGNNIFLSTNLIVT